ncbi:MAG: uracil phosphoribosyltransferase, partial [Candidatus Dormibacteraeota bacterium]|nr:uracil phosphoribosyltransferase [Candidatus Dormibacteraeota bacterium]
MPLHVSTHPVVQDCLAGLRERGTEPEEFRVLARRIITFLVFEATADLPSRSALVQTPLQEAAVSVIDRDVVAIP